MIDDPDLGPIFRKQTLTSQEDDTVLLRVTVARNTCGVLSLTSFAPDDVPGNTASRGPRRRRGG